MIVHHYIVFSPVFISEKQFHQHSNEFSTSKNGEFEDKVKVRKDRGRGVSVCHPDFWFLVSLTYCFQTVVISKRIVIEPSTWYNFVRLSE